MITDLEIEELEEMQVHPVIVAKVRQLRAIEAAARRVRTERNAFLASVAGSGCQRAMSLEAAERDLDALLDAKETG